MQFSQKDVKKSGRARRRGFGGATIGSMLMSGLTLFMLLIMAVGGVAAYFLYQNGRSLHSINEQSLQAKQVLLMSNHMLHARVSLLVAARYQQEASASTDVALKQKAADTLGDATKMLDAVKKKLHGFSQEPARRSRCPAFVGEADQHVSAVSG